MQADPPEKEDCSMLGAAEKQRHTTPEEALTQIERTLGSNSLCPSRHSPET